MSFRENLDFEQYHELAMIVDIISISHESLLRLVLVKTLIRLIYIIHKLYTQNLPLDQISNYENLDISNLKCF